MCPQFVQTNSTLFQPALPPVAFWYSPTTQNMQCCRTLGFKMCALSCTRSGHRVQSVKQVCCTLVAILRAHCNSLVKYFINEVHVRSCISCSKIILRVCILFSRQRFSAT